jgi:hypothetical protein
VLTAALSRVMAAAGVSAGDHPAAAPEAAGW